MTYVVFCVAVICAATLQGCAGPAEGHGNSTETTPAPVSNVTTQTTTTTTTTTHILPGGCHGLPLSNVKSDTEWETPQQKSLACFCLYAGYCHDKFTCQKGSRIEDCTKAYCGSSPFNKGSATVSFTSTGQSSDILTIPTNWFLDVAHLPGMCKDGGKKTLATVLLEGRRAYMAVAKSRPEWQCFHLGHMVGVKWMHLHSFSGHVSAEHLPDGSFEHPPTAVCAPGSLSEDMAAEAMLSSIGAIQADDNLPWYAEDIILRNASSSTTTRATVTTTTTKMDVIRYGYDDDGADDFQDDDVDIFGMQAGTVIVN